MHQPFLYKQMVLEGKQKEKSDSLSLGTAVHLKLLEPHRKDLVKNLADYGFEDRKQWRAIRKLEEDNPESHFFSPKDYEKISDMCNSVKLHDKALRLYASGTWNEVSLFFDIDGRSCKARCDTVNMEQGYVIDLKTTKDSKNFMKEVVDYSYHVQAAFYRRGLTKVTGEVFDWYWVAVCSESPHFTYVYKATEETLRIGDIVVDELLSKLAICEEEDMWPIGNEEIIEGNLPSWYAARFSHKEFKGEKK